MNLAERIVRSYFESAPMVATLRLDGAPVGESVPVVWRISGGIAEFEHVWVSQSYHRFDEAVVMEGQLVVAQTEREFEPTPLPVGATYTGRFSVRLLEV